LRSTPELDVERGVNNAISTPTTSKRKRFWIGVLAVYLLIGLGCQLGLLATNWVELQSGKEMQAPSFDAWLGTDHLGRDLLAQLMQGVRIALAVGLLAAGGAAALGTLLGLLGGWFGGWTDKLILWMSSTVVAIPGVLLVLAIASAMGKGMTAVITSFALVSWVGVYRLVRSETLRLRQADFILAARVGGQSTAAILWRHFLPHLQPLIRVQFSLGFVWAIQTEAILSFLGVGMIEHPSWGRMIADAWAWNDLGQGNGWRLLSATLALALLSLTVQKLATDPTKSRPKR
jgi:peptide/nickel transport system permease protein